MSMKIRQLIRQIRHEREFQILANTPRYNQISEWITKWRKHEYNRWAMDDCDLFKLYDYILTRQPRTVVEFGTGTGYASAVIGYAIQQLKQTKFISLEQDSDLYSFAKRIVPQKISPYVYFHLAPITVLKIHHWGAFLAYKFDFHQKIDLAIIDGPVGFVIENPNKGKFINFYSVKRQKKFPSRSKKEQKIFKMNMELFGKHHMLDNLNKEKLKSMGLLNEFDEVTTRTVRKSALFQIFENASDKLEVIVEGSHAEEWEPLLEEMGYCQIAFGHNTKLLKKKEH